jgi:hypothetical protein
MNEQRATVIGGVRVPNWAPWVVFGVVVVLLVWFLSEGDAAGAPAVGAGAAPGALPGAGGGGGSPAGAGNAGGAVAASGK